MKLYFIFKLHLILKFKFHLFHIFQLYFYFWHLIRFIIIFKNVLKNNLFIKFICLFHETLLHLAVRSGNKEITKLLLKYKETDINAISIFFSIFNYI